MSTLPGEERKMIDVHMHLIPCVDDGAEDMEMAMAMIIRAWQQGIRQIIATPHSEAFRYSRDGGRIMFRRLENAAERLSMDMKLRLGCEVYCDTGIMDRVLEDLDSGRFPTMNGTKYVLTEFSPWMRAEDAFSCVEALVDAGYKPIIAHMERYRYFREDMALTDRFRDMGALIQLNVYSLYDESNDDIKNWARRLVLERKADFLGTDAHRSYHRPPCAEYGLNWLYENADPEYADAIAWGNAQKLLWN